jgi:CubicO group peptidase (beta-lactamase class C family)
LRSEISGNSGVFFPTGFVPVSAVPEGGSIRSVLFCRNRLFGRLHHGRVMINRPVDDITILAAKAWHKKGHYWRATSWFWQLPKKYNYAGIMIDRLYAPIERHICLTFPVEYSDGKNFRQYPLSIGLPFANNYNNTKQAYQWKVNSLMRSFLLV